VVRKRRVGKDNIALDNLVVWAKRWQRFAESFVAYPGTDYDSEFYTRLIRNILLRKRFVDPNGNFVRSRPGDISATTLGKEEIIDVAELAQPIEPPEIIEPVIRQPEIPDPIIIVPARLINVQDQIKLDTYTGYSPLIVSVEDYLNLEDNIGKFYIYITEYLKMVSNPGAYYVEVEDALDISDAIEMFYNDPKMDKREHLALDDEATVQLTTWSIDVEDRVRVDDVVENAFVDASLSIPTIEDRVIIKDRGRIRPRKEVDEYERLKLDTETNILVLEPGVTIKTWDFETGVTGPPPDNDWIGKELWNTARMWKEVGSPWYPFLSGSGYGSGWPAAGIGYGGGVGMRHYGYGHGFYGVVNYGCFINPGVSGCLAMYNIDPPILEGGHTYVVSFRSRFAESEYGSHRADCYPVMYVGPPAPLTDPNPYLDGANYAPPYDIFGIFYYDDFKPAPGFLETYWQQFVLPDGDGYYLESNGPIGVGIGVYRDYYTFQDPELDGGPFIIIDDIMVYAID
jgi:hypothetical protein